MLMKGTAARMGVMKRVSLVFKAKANKALDKMEDPRETLDYSYQRQLELLTKVRRGVADVATSRKRVELQMNQLQQQSNKLEDQARKALGMGREDLARGRARAQGVGAGPAERPAGAVCPAAGRGGEADGRLPAAAVQGGRLPYQEGDHQGHLHRGRGPDQDQRGVLRHLRGDGRRRHGDPAGRGQDGPDAGPRGRDRRADGLGRAGRRRGRPARRHPERARHDVREQRRRERAEQAQGRDHGRGAQAARGRRQRQQPRRPRPPRPGAQCTPQGQAQPASIPAADRPAEPQDGEG